MLYMLTCIDFVAEVFFRVCMVTLIILKIRIKLSESNNCETMCSREIYVHMVCAKYIIT